MTMILQLVVAAMAVGLIVAGPPEYKQNLAAVREAKAIMKSNLLSMEDNIPLLNDSRRHYAVITQVIYDHDVFLNSGGVDETYQDRLNKSASEGLNNPELVIDEIKDLIVQVDSRTSQLKEQIDACVLDDDVCNKQIDYIVLENYHRYEPQVDILFAAGNAANELNKRNGDFEEVSRDLEGLWYVISEPQALKDVKDAVLNLLEKLALPPATDL